MNDTRRYRGKLTNGKGWVFGFLVEQDDPEYHCYIITSFKAELDEEHADILECNIA